MSLDTVESKPGVPEIEGVKEMKIANDEDEDEYEETVPEKIDKVEEIPPKASKIAEAVTEKILDANNTEYIIVQDPTSDELTEIPTSDGFVLMTTLQSSFPGSTGLKFKNPKTGVMRAVQVDTTGIKLLPPTDGWDDKTFSVVVAPQSERVRVLPSADATSAKRRKVGSGGDDSDSEDERDGRSGRKRASQHTDRDGGRQPVDLIVLGVDFKTREDVFRNYFDDLGEVVFCEIKKKTDGQSKGFGFVRMATIDDQNKVLAIPQHMIDGRRCDVKVPEGKDRSSKPSISRIFVGRLTDKIDEEDLRKKFSDEARKYVDTAVVTDVFIPKPFRGFAFVTLSSAEAAERVVSKGSFSVNGVSIGISIAQPREDTQSAGADYGLPAGYRRRAADRRSSDYPSREEFIQYQPPRVMPFERDRERPFWSPTEQPRRWY